MQQATLQQPHDANCIGTGTETELGETFLSKYKLSFIISEDWSVYRQKITLRSEYGKEKLYEWENQ